MQGLSSKEVQQSQKQYGKNTFTVQKRIGFWQRFAENLKDPIIRILMGTLVLSALLLLKDGCLSEVCGIASAILISTFVSTFSECNSQRAFARLQAEGAQRMCKVLRNHSISTLPIEELAVGDVVLLESGEQVPADGFLISGDLYLDFSALNGESKERHRSSSAQKDDTYAIDTPFVLLRGALITAGSGQMLVGRVGDATLYGSLAQEIQGQSVQSPLKEKLSRLGSVISKIGYCSAVLVAAADLFTSFVLSGQTQTVVSIAQNLIHALSLGVTVIVVAVPEGLPMMISVVLSANVFRMMKQQVLVKKPVGIETAGGIQILFCDKTGTLTRGTPQIHRYLFGDGTFAASLPYSKGARRSSLLLQAMHNTASLLADGEVVGGNSTDRLLFSQVQSMSSAARKEGEGWRKTDFTPFDSTQKYSRAVIQRSGKSITLYKGAPERLLALCDTYLCEDGSLAPLHTQSNPMMYAWQQALEQGDRFLALVQGDGDVPLSAGLTFVALVQMKDSVRAQAKEAVSELHSAGVQVVMITGDHPKTAQSVAQQCGILEPSQAKEGVLCAQELHQMQDEQIAALLPRLRVVARALPSDKSRLVRIAQSTGLVVGMTGDGLNDAPALKAADVGFAMGAGTEVTKEAADIVILDNHIASIARAVLFGRTIFASIRKFVAFQLTMNVCAVLVSMIAPFLGIDTPITVMQMLWVNLIMDTLAGIAFAGEAPEPKMMRQKPITRATPVLTREMAVQIGAMGGFCVSLCLFFLQSRWIDAQFAPQAKMTAFFTLFVFCGVFCAFHARTPKNALFCRLLQNRTFLWIMGAVLLVQIGMVYYGGTAFRCTPLTYQELQRTLMLSATVLPAEGLRKTLAKLWRKRPKRS